MARKKPLAASGRTVVLEFDSKILARNPLRDPSLRKVAVWLPPGYDDDTVRGRSSGRGRRYPVLFDLVGFTGSGLAHLNWRPFDENVAERAARLVHEKKMGPCIIVFPDCFTSLGGNQYINSSAMGDYADYLTKELIPFVDREFRTLASREHRGCFGKSSGGYGSMIHGMKYAKYWGAIAEPFRRRLLSIFAIHALIGRDTLNVKSMKHRKRPKRVAGCDQRYAASEKKVAANGIDDGRVKRFPRSHVWKKEKLSERCRRPCADGSSRWPRATIPIRENQARTFAFPSISRLASGCRCAAGTRWLEA